MTFALWTESQKETACEEGVSYAGSLCNETDPTGTQSCYPCAYLVSYVYTKY